MSAKIGILGVAKKIKRIYIGVDGKARRVKKIYTTRSLYGNDDTRRIYNDSEQLQVSVKGNFGNLSGRLTAVIRDGATGKYLITGNFVNKYTLSELSTDSLNSPSASLTGRTLSLGSASAPYEYASFIGNNNYDTDKYPVYFSGAANGSVYVKRINLYSMQEVKTSDSDSASFSFFTGNTISTGPQPADGATYDDAFPPKNFLSISGTNVVTYGRPNICAAHASNGTLTKSTLIEGYYLNTASVRTGSYVSKYEAGYPTSKEFIAKTSSNTLELVNVATLYDLNTGNFYDIKKCGSYTLTSMPSSPKNINIGAALNIDTYGTAGNYKSNLYANTFNCQDNTKRYCGLIVDFGTELSDDNVTPKFSPVEYVESFDLPADATRAQNYNWHILGWDGSSESSRFLYVLSTVDDIITIIKFKVDGDQIIKVSEYDTGKRLSSTVTLNTVVPLSLPLASREISSSKAGYMLAFMLTVNNEYNEIVVVPRALIQ